MAAGAAGKDDEAFIAELNDTVTCLGGRISLNNRVWQGVDPFIQTFPVLTEQLTFLILASRLIVYLCRPFNLPKIVPELLSGVLVGPLLLGRWVIFNEEYLYLNNTFTWETLANLGLIYYAFTVGLESDIVPILRPDRQALSVAVAGTIIPFIVGYLMFSIAGGSFIPEEAFYHDIPGNPEDDTPVLPRGPIFIGAFFSSTGYAPVSEILGKLKLLNTEIGRTAMAAAMVSEAITWGILAIGMPLSVSAAAFRAGFVALVGVVLVCFGAMGPGVAWLLRGKKGQGEEEDGDRDLSEMQMSVLMAAVMGVGFGADIMGMYPLVAVFLLGQAIPDRLLRLSIVDKLEDAVGGIFLPLFFGFVFLNIGISPGALTQWAVRLFGVVIMVCITKLVCTLPVSLYYNMSLRDSAALGILLSSKNILSVLFLHIAMDRKGMKEQNLGKTEYQFIQLEMVVSLLMLMIGMTPLLKRILRPSTGLLEQKGCRSVEELLPNSQLRILAVVHYIPDVPGLISLLQISHPSKHSPMAVFVLRLLELTGRGPAKLFIQDMRNPTGGHRRVDAEEAADNAQLLDLFNTFEADNAGAAVVHPHLSVSLYQTMHEDACNLADDTGVTLIIIPFHYSQNIDGGMESGNPYIRGVNQNVLSQAPCSVGIFVDRGFSSVDARAPVRRRVCVLFFGGPDDREALYYGWRMRGHREVSLNVVRVLLGDEGSDLEVFGTPGKSNNPMMLDAQSDYEKQKQLDDVVVGEFRVKTVGDELVTYTEMVANSGEDTVMLVKNMDHRGVDLYIVGKGDRVLSPLTIGLNDWSDWPELGAVGDILVSSDCTAQCSVVVMQQHVGTVRSSARASMNLLRMDGSIRKLESMPSTPLRRGSSKLQKSHSHELY